MEQAIRIVLADDHALFRQGLKSLLRLQPNVTIVGETERADDVSALVCRTPCDVLLLDIEMDRSSLGDVRSLAQRVAVVIVTASEEPEDALEAIRCGARAVVFKRFAIEDLMNALAAVVAGNVWMPPSLQAYVAAGLQSPASELLTPREREVVRHVALGLRNFEVAKKLFISEQTVKTHLNNVFQKVGVRDRVELTLYAARAGIIGIHERPPRKGGPGVSS
jgi:DNA-binding NarL/FixJ family response regulator